MSVVAAAGAVLGGALVAVGVGLWSLPGGLVCGGVELVAGGYVAAYLGAGRRR